MGLGQCAVCGKEVAKADQDDHLRSQHLGPHYYWFCAQPFRTMAPSMRADDFLKMHDRPLPPQGFLCEDRDGKTIYYRMTDAIDLTHKPQLFILHSATMHRHPVT